MTCVASYLTLFQIGVLDEVWDPWADSQTVLELTAPVPDAFAGALVSVRTKRTSPSGASGYARRMSATSGHGFVGAGSYSVARQRRLRRVLDTYGPLTESGLHELVGAEGWHVPFDVVLHRAIRSERVRRLGDELYEVGPTR